MDENYAKEAREARRRFLDSQDELCGYPGCRYPKRAHGIFQFQGSVTDHVFVKREESQ